MLLMFRMTTSQLLPYICGSEWMPPVLQIDGCSSPVVLPGKLEMSTVTFLNPEYGTRKFVSQYLKRIQVVPPLS